jgi:hypothetical protein
VKSEAPESGVSPDKGIWGGVAIAKTELISGRRGEKCMASTGEHIQCGSSDMLSKESWLVRTEVLLISHLPHQVLPGIGVHGLPDMDWKSGVGVCNWRGVIELRTYSVREGAHNYYCT